MVKQEFGNRLYRMMLARQWTQSELARQADLPRDSISVYIRGKSLPTPLSLDKLSSALNVPKEELLPSYAESAIDEDMPAIELKVSPNAPNTAWLRINQMVPLDVALKITGLLKDAADRKGSSDGSPVQSVEG
jgi:transcriptional regulator with XRE-family HTH domain